MTDPIVEAVRADLLARSQRGIATYGTTLARTDLTQEDWKRHLYEELLDAACYLRRLMHVSPRPPLAVAWGSPTECGDQDFPTTLHERMAAQNTGHCTCGHEGHE